MTEFMHGLDLCQAFFTEAVQPILEREFPGLVYDAALIGPGSEVLGYDTPISMDHHWGPKTQLFLRDDDRPRFADSIKAVLSERLPVTVSGIPTSFGPPDQIGVQLLQTIDSGPVRHLVYVHGVGDYVKEMLGFEVRSEPSVAEWLTFPEHKLLTLTSGRLFHEGLGSLGLMRRRLAYYPYDIWLYLLAAQWTRISQEEAFVARCGDAGDELGSRLVAARLVRELMRLCFLLERRYAPYSKWFGTAFAQLDAATDLTPVFSAALDARDWKAREGQLCRAYAYVAEKHNNLKITAPLSSAVLNFHDRPYMVLGAERFATAIKATITDPAVQSLPLDIGSINQFVDSTDILQKTTNSRRLRLMFEVE